MKENKNAAFIKTKDKYTADIMKKSGFNLVDETDGIWTFVNDSSRPLVFEDNKVFYSNMLCI